MIALAGLAAMLAVWLLVPAPGPGLKRLMGERKHARPLGVWQTCVGVDIVAMFIGLLVKQATLVAALALVATTVTWVVVSKMNAKKATIRMQEVVRAAQVLESLLALGHIPSAALTVAAQECPVLEPVAGQLRLGGEPWEVMEQLAGVAGQEGLRQISCAWQVAQESGASMHESLERVRITLEEAADTGVIVAGELASARTTSQILAVLPFAGLGMAVFMGSNPLQFFTGSIIGRACLLVGLSLACLGLMWSERQARSAQSDASSEKRRLT